MTKTSSKSTEATGTSTTTEADTVDQSSVNINTGDSYTRNVEIDWSPWTKHFDWEDDD